MTDCHASSPSAGDPSGVASFSVGESPGPHPQQRDHDLLGFVLLAALAAAICFFGLAGGPAMGDHECIHAQCARQVRQGGDWLVPYFNDIPRINKPPLGTWLIVLSSLVVDPPGLNPPVSTLAARLPQAFAGFLNVLVICWLGTLMFGRRTGLVAGFIAAASLTTIYFSHNALIEMTLVLFTTLSYACFWRGACGERADRRWMVAFYAVFALANLAKAPLPLALVGLPLAAYWLLARPALLSGREPMSAATGTPARWLAGAWSQLKAVPTLWLVPGLILFLAITLPWILYVGFTEHGAWALWKTEFLDRYSGQMSARSQPWWYYLPMLFGFATPFLLSVPEAVAAALLPRYRAQRHALVYLLIWGALGAVFLSTSSFKRPHYVASIMPAFLLMLAPVIDRLFFGQREHPSRAVTAACYTLLGIVTVGLVAAGIYVALDMGHLLRLYVAIAAGLLTLWGGACLAYRFDLRAASFALLCLGSLVMTAGGWTASKHVLRTDARAYALAERLSRLDLQPDDRIIWVDSRVDATTAFYGHLRIDRLFTPLEMSQLRKGRKRLPPEVISEAAQRMDSMLLADRTTYFILDAARYEQFRNHFDLPARVLFRVTGFNPDPRKDLVVLGAAEQPASTTAPTQDEPIPPSAPSPHTR